VQSIISVANLVKTYATGFQALKSVNWKFVAAKFFALLGPNGAGKTTLINIICGIVNATSGTVRADGHDIVRDWRAARSLIGLVPQELSSNAFESPLATLKFSRGLFGKTPNPGHLEKVLRDLALWDKKDSPIMTLSGGMKRRVMIAKSARTRTADFVSRRTDRGPSDVELRRDMWEMVRRLRESGVTIILTTHYIEEAEEMADRVGVISKGEIIVRRRESRAHAQVGTQTTHAVPATNRSRPSLPPSRIDSSEIAGEGTQLIYTFDAQTETGGIAGLLRHAQRIEDRVQGSAYQREFAGRYFRQFGEEER